MHHFNRCHAFCEYIMLSQVDTARSSARNFGFHLVSAKVFAYRDAFVIHTLEPPGSHLKPLYLYRRTRSPSHKYVSTIMREMYNSFKLSESL